MPLLVRTLCCVRYSGLSVLQMQLAWYAAQKLATLVSAVVKQPPVPPPSMVLTKASSENLRLLEGLPVLMLHDEEERMAGGEGSLRLAIAMGGGGAEGNRAIVMGGDGDGGDDDGGASSAIDVAQRPIDFDGMSQRVLPDASRPSRKPSPHSPPLERSSSRCAEATGAPRRRHRRRAPSLDGRSLDPALVSPRRLRRPRGAAQRGSGGAGGGGAEASRRGQGGTPRDHQREARQL